MPNLSDLDWQPVLLVKVTREPVPFQTNSDIFAVRQTGGSSDFALQAVTA
ncbi:MAG: hypothetical protein K8I82_31570 [Anaerolineae bacterium]|nr:hypothetical protein [Anaerolineae bacterium]